MTSSTAKPRDQVADISRAIGLAHATQLALTDVRAGFTTADPVRPDFKRAFVLARMLEEELRRIRGF